MKDCNLFCTCFLHKRGVASRYLVACSRSFRLLFILKGCALFKQLRYISIIFITRFSLVCCVFIAEIIYWNGSMHTLVASCLQRAYSSRFTVIRPMTSEIAMVTGWCDACCGRLLVRLSIYCQRVLTLNIHPYVQRISVLVVSLTANRHAHIWSVLSFLLSCDRFAPRKEHCLRSTIS